MNSNKARDLFSEYSEGTLNPGLKAGFERCLEQDPALREEYRQYLVVVQALEARRDEPVEAPFDLHDRIMARIDKSIFDSRRAPSVGLFERWRLAMFGGLGTVAVAATVIALVNAQRPGVETSEANLLSGGREAAVSFAWREGQLFVVHPGESVGVVEVLNPEDKRVVGSIPYTSEGLNRALENKAPRSVVREIKTGKQTLLVAIPGTERERRETGEGTAADVARALADGLGVAVQLDVKDPGAVRTWRLKGDDPVATEVDGKTVVSRLPNGLYLLKD